jgi:hypothetical protein
MKRKRVIKNWHLLLSTQYLLRVRVVRLEAAARAVGMMLRLHRVALLSRRLQLLAVGGLPRVSAVLGSRISISVSSTITKPEFERHSHSRYAA